MEVIQVQEWLSRTNEDLQEQKDYLTSLDRAIGDGDHGINMARGFKEVTKSLEGKDFTEVSDVLKAAATTVMSKVGGASGPLYGTALLKMSMACKGKQVDYKTLIEMVEAGLEGIKQRGKAETGEKTMVDVWTPVLSGMKEVDHFDGERIKHVAEEAKDNTESMQATKGRAAYLKERSKGHLDPGAVSSYFLFKNLALVMEEA
ncbi:dihydroxyacetone kinase subunit DhaL [Halobacillus litoralis]|uniref:dihydroxyacetone kinase subunit DhaL n=1 Tax=Halobacillus litoralis TaxID=45668 RepID=UPI001CFE3D17|nr:dihydroxyacetone kinase subunit DhaL [Halobacillus litoralis]